MYLRFVLQSVDSDSHRKQGILVAAAELLEEGDLEDHEHKDVRELCAWFDDNLHVPKVLKKEESSRALSWFRPSAKEALAKMWSLVAILENHGLPIELLKTSDPGIVIHEDKWQIVAKPRRGKKRPW